MNKNLYKHPKVYEAFDLYCRQWCEGLPTDEELSGVTFSPAFEEKMRVLIRRQKYGFYVLFGTAKRCVASVVLMLLLAGLTIATFSVRAWREPVVRFFTEVFETFTSVLFEDDKSPVAEVKLKRVVPAYIPEGYEIESEIGDDMVYRVIYYNVTTKQRIRYTQRQNELGTQTIDTEGNSYHNISVNGISGITYDNKGYINVVFNYDNVTYSFSRFISKEELLHIAESVPIK